MSNLVTIEKGKLPYTNDNLCVAEHEHSGESPNSKMDDTLWAIDRAAHFHRASVLITGPTGSGKTRAAQIIHQESDLIPTALRILPLEPRA
jgi:DNA-binding NtrC family response regulator